MVIKKVSLLLTTLFIANTTWAETYSNEEKNTNFIFTPSVAYRYDVFKWSTSFYPLSQKKESELIWKNHITQPSIKIEIEPQPNQFTFLGQAKYGYILKSLSNSWDLDWFNTKENSGPYSETKSSVRGNILDLSGAIGYSVSLFKGDLLTFYVGYDYTDYRNKDYGCLELALNTHKISYPFNKLLGKYYFKTQSPWLGLSFNIPLTDKFSITPAIKLYSFKYVGKGYWFSRDDLQHNPSFMHNAKGRGIGFDIDFLYKYSPNLDLALNLETKKIKMKHGRKKTFYKNRLHNGKLYDLSLLSSSISIGLKYKL